MPLQPQRGLADRRPVDRAAVERGRQQQRMPAEHLPHCDQDRLVRRDHAPRRFDPARAPERQQPPAFLGIQPVPGVELEAGGDRRAVGCHEAGAVLPGDVLDADEGRVMPRGLRGRHQVGHLRNLVLAMRLGGEVDVARQAEPGPARDQRVVDPVPLVAARARARAGRRFLEPGELHDRGFEQRGGRLGVELEQLDVAIGCEAEIEAAIERRLARTVRRLDQGREAVGEAEGGVVAARDDARHRFVDHAMRLARRRLERRDRIGRQRVAGVARPVFAIIGRVEGESQGFRTAGEGVVADQRVAGDGGRHGGSVARRGVRHPLPRGANRAHACSSGSAWCRG